MKVKSLFLIIAIALFCAPSPLFAQKNSKERIDFPLQESDYFLEGIHAYNQRNFNLALGCFQACLNIDPSNDAATFYYGLSTYSLGNQSEAEQFLKKAVELDPENIWYRIYLANYYTGANDIEKSISIYEKILADFPDKTSLYYDLIDLYINNQQIDMALSTIESIEKDKGKNEATLSVKYELLNHAGKTEEADAILLELYSDFPSANVAYVLGDKNLSLYKDTLALTYYQRALELDNDFDLAYYGIAEIYRYRGQYNYFFENITPFIKSKNIDSSSKLDYIFQSLVTPQFIQAFEPQLDNIMECLLTAHPTDSLSISGSAAYFSQTGKLDKAEVLYEKNYSLYPQSYSTTFEYISLLYYLEDWNRLIPITFKSLEYFPNDLDLLEILAICYWRIDDLDKTIKVYDLMVEELDKDKNAEEQRWLYVYTSLGDLYNAKDNTKKAYSYYKKALKIDPEYNPLLNNYAYALAKDEKKLTQALKMSAKTISDEPDNPTYLDTFAYILYLMGEYETAKEKLKHAMLYGGRESAAIMDHYADILFALGDYDLAFMYWEDALKLDSSIGIEEKIIQKKQELSK